VPLQSAGEGLFSWETVVVSQFLLWISRQERVEGRKRISSCAFAYNFLGIRPNLI
jgi:hypothetical protein